MTVVEITPTFASWQAAARRLLLAGVHPAAVAWQESPEAPLPAGGPGPGGTVRVPRAFVEIAQRVAATAAPDRWSVLYGVLWRLVHEDRNLLARAGDPAVARLRALDPGVPAAPGASPRAGDGVSRGGAPAAPRRPLPEGPAPSPAAGSAGAPGAAAFVPPGADVEGLRAAARLCTGCELYRHATQTVFSAGPADARIVLVGEQPGDQEDLRGAPFVGPAGEVLDRALAEVGLDRARLYVTNAVKHFKFVARGKRRIHQTPTPADIAACRPWIEAELALLRPEILVCLGSTAGRALVGPDFRVLRDRGRFFPTRWAPKTLATLHPSAVLRGEDEAAQARLYAMLRDDLRLCAGAG